MQLRLGNRTVMLCGYWDLWLFDRDWPIGIRWVLKYIPANARRASHLRGPSKPPHVKIQGHWCFSDVRLLDLTWSSRKSGEDRVVSSENPKFMRNIICTKVWLILIFLERGVARTSDRQPRRLNPVVNEDGYLNDVRSRAIFPVQLNVRTTFLSTVIVYIN